MTFLPSPPLPSTVQGDTALELVHDRFASPFMQALLRAAAGDKWVMG